MKNSTLLLCMGLLMLGACAKEGGDVWSDIDYARIARDNYRKENDSYYIPPPTVNGCTDDDLYNCRTRGGTY